MILRRFITIRYKKIGLYPCCSCCPAVRPDDNSTLLCSDLPNLDAWVELFRKSIPTYQKLAAKDPSARDRKSAEVSSQTLQSHCLHTLQETDLCKHSPFLRLQQAAERFAKHYDELMRQLAKDPLANLPGFGSEPLSIFRIVALR